MVNLQENSIGAIMNACERRRINMSTTMTLRLDDETNKRLSSLGVQERERGERVRGERVKRRKGQACVNVLIDTPSLNSWFSCHWVMLNDLI